MPNFGDARNTLAKEASWEPEEPEESEDERKLPYPRLEVS
jgi:Ras GTPase-activating-like protein IQGAP2/3